MPSLSLQCLFLERDSLRAAFMKLLLSGRSRPPGPSSVIAVLHGLALLLDWGPLVTKPLAGGTGALQLSLSRSAKAALEDTRIVSKCQFLNS